jgi:BirA family biotin operon repressor/biotin-[acetyl-CoA-carboxylase] ligase
LASDQLALAEAVQSLPAPWQAHYFAALDSTQDEARAAARRGAPSRSLFVAEFQRAGRGRQGRTWLAQPGSALLLSMLFREVVGAPTPWRYTSLASLALVEAIEHVLPRLVPLIKWPNDVMLGDRKVAGILAETTWDGHELVVCVGVGINVNTQEADLAQIPGATSLTMASGQRFDRGALLESYIGCVDRLIREPPATVHDAWQARLWRRGQRLRLDELGIQADVVVLGVEPDGVLRVRLADGTERRTTTGELLP